LSGSSYLWIGGTDAAVEVVTHIVASLIEWQWPKHLKYLSRIPYTSWLVHVDCSCGEYETCFCTSQSSYK
jgi:hypothetical protein